MKASLNKLRLRAGVDRPVFYSGLGQAWSLFSGPITILMVTHFFTPETQGYFYTFGSVLAIQVFLELGFSQCIVQFASHEFVHLRFRPGGGLEGEPLARSRLLSLGRLSLKWYGVIGILAFIGLGIGGHGFFVMKPPERLVNTHVAAEVTALNHIEDQNHLMPSANVSSAHPGTDVSWPWPWWCLCLATGLSMALQPVGALLEGCNQMAFVYGLRTLSRIVASVVLWGAVWGGAQLFTGSIMVFAMVILTAVAYGWLWRGLLRDLWRAPKGESISWRREIWPFQWRIAISCVSGYFIFNFFTPVLLKFHGPVVAGQMGATLSLVASLNALASAWTISKGPRFGMLIRQRQFAELDRLFYRATVQAVGVCCMGGAALLLGLVLVREHFAIGARFIGPGPTILLVLATVVNQVVFGQAVYLRAHKQEPFMVLSAANGVLTGLLMLGFGYYFAAWGVALAYTLVQVAVFVWASVVWGRCRQEWHLLTQQAA